MSNRGFLFDCITNEVYINNNKYASHQNHCVIIRSRQNLIERYGLTGMVKVFNEVAKTHEKQVVVEDHWTSEDLSKALWKMFEEITNDQIRDERRLKRAIAAEAARENRGDSPPRTMPKRIRWPRTYKVCFTEISEELRPTKRSTIPHQARVILERLRSQPLEILTEDELKLIMKDLVESGALVTKQHFWRIWLYYEMKLHSHGLVKRMIERVEVQG